MTAPRDIAGQLAPGETLLWQGRPAPGARAAAAGMGCLRWAGAGIFGLMAAMALLVWQVADGSGGAGFVAAFMGLGAFAGGMLIWGIPALSARAMAATRYGVIPGHALILPPRGRLQRWPLDPAFSLRTEAHPPHVRVIFGRDRRLMRIGDNHAKVNVDLAFEGLPPDQAEAALAALRAAAL